MFIAALFTTAKTWKQSKCHEKMIRKKEWCTHTHNGILVSHKNNEILPFAARWMNLEDIILTGISQTNIL